MSNHRQKGMKNPRNQKGVQKQVKTVEALAKKLITIVETHPEILDWSAMNRYPSLSYHRINGYSRYYECMQQAKEYVNSVFEDRLVKLGLERSKTSDSFVKFMLARRHGWVETQKIEADVKANISFRDLIAGGKDDEDEEDEYEDPTDGLPNARQIDP